VLGERSELIYEVFLVGSGGVEVTKPFRTMTTEEAGFIEAIYGSPGDNALRLVYADWLEERSDPGSNYLRAEVEHFRTQSDIQDSVVWSLREQVDLIWAEMVSRSPFGILVPGLTFWDTGPRIGSAHLAKIERRWGKRLPPDYAAFLLRYNGGRPSKRYLWSYAAYDDRTEHYYDEVRLFSTEDRHSSGKPYLRMSVVEAFHNHVAEGWEKWLPRYMPIGMLTLSDGFEHMLALGMDDNAKFPRILELEYLEDRGLSGAWDTHWQNSFVGLLMALRERSEV